MQPNFGAFFFRRSEIYSKLFLLFEQRVFKKIAGRPPERSGKVGED